MLCIFLILQITYYMRPAIHDNDNIKKHFPPNVAAHERSIRTNI